MQSTHFCFLREKSICIESLEKENLLSQSISNVKIYLTLKESLHSWFPTFLFGLFWAQRILSELVSGSLVSLKIMVCLPYVNFTYLKRLSKEPSVTLHPFFHLQPLNIMGLKQIKILDSTMTQGNENLSSRP